MTILWQTDEIRHERPRVGDEVKNALFYLEEVLYPLVPRTYAHLEDAVGAAYGAGVAVPPLLRFGSWVGADMDGNPNVTPEVAIDTAMAHAARAVALHLREVLRLGARLSQSTRRIGVTDELRASLERDRAAHPERADDVEARTRDEPYRRKLRWIEAKLAATRAAFVAARASGGRRTTLLFGYRGAGAARRRPRSHRALAGRQRGRARGALARQGAHAAGAGVRVPPGDARRTRPGRVGARVGGRSPARRARDARDAGAGDHAAARRRRRAPSRSS